MRILDENFAVEADGNGYKLLKIIERNGSIRYEPVSTFLELRSLSTFYLSSRMSDDMSNESFCKIRETVRQSFKNIRRIMHDFENMKTYPEANRRIA